MFAKSKPFPPPMEKGNQIQKYKKKQKSNQMKIKIKINPFSSLSEIEYQSNQISNAISHK